MSLTKQDLRQPKLLEINHWKSMSYKSLGKM